MAKSSLVRVLAGWFLAGAPTVDQVTERGARALGRPWRWLRPLAERYARMVATRPRPRHREVVRFLLDDQGFQSALSKYSSELSIEHLWNAPQPMQPVAAAAGWPLPVIASAGDLAAWLGLDLGELRWFADLKELGRYRRSGRMHHYHYKIVPKPSGALRLIEIPKPDLKALQRKILSEILDRIPVHSSVHGFVKGRSIKTFVAPHVGRRVIVRIDLEDFFPSFRAARIQAFFRTLGYPETVADLLGGICTNAVPRYVFRDRASSLAALHLHDALDLYGRPHLPQGAPTSPTLANLCTYRIDCRLRGFALSAGAEYSRYADDLAFSGDGGFARSAERFVPHVAAILREEGFSVNFHKTRVMRQGVRQRLAGVTINKHPNITRADFDRLKAVLTNCVRSGPGSQNRDAHPHFREHLRGCVGFVESINPSRGKRLRAILNQIEWQ